jgi:hypothetical protein
MAEEIKSAAEATEIAVSFIKKYRPYARPLTAIKEDGNWLVEVDVGPFLTLIAKFKIDAKTGTILEYTIPS